MPYYKKSSYTKKAPAKKRTYRKKKAYSGTLRVPKLRNAVTDRMMCKLKYADVKTLTSTTGSVATHQFAINDLFDPDYTGTGHQPLYFDEYAAIYNKYKVFGCKYKIMILSKTDDVNGMLSINASDDSTTPVSSATEFMEQGNARQAVVSGQEGQNRKYITGYFSIKKLLGVKNLQDDDFRTAVSTNPSNRVFMNLCYQSFDSGTSSLNVAIVLTFYSEFSNKKLIGQS